MSNEEVKIIGKPASSPSYAMESNVTVCGNDNEFLVASSLCQGGANETFKGTLDAGRPYQQDRAFSGATGATLTTQNLLRACDIAADATKDCIDGSTASIAALNPDGALHVANIADSPVMLFIIDQNNRVRGHYLIKDPHDANPKIPIKKDKVLRDAPQYQDEITYDALEKRFYPISISHGLGDKPYSLDPTPSVNSYDVNSYLEEAGQGGRILLCVASDGICPPEKAGQKCRSDEEWAHHYARIMEEHLSRDKNASVETLSTVIMNEAIACRQAQAEQDNILLQLAEIKPDRHDTLYMVVCDGHRATDYEGNDLRGNCAQLAAETLHAALSRSKSIAAQQVPNRRRLNI